jgi:hypothetical protein
MESPNIQNTTTNESLSHLPEPTEKAIEELLHSSAENTDTIIISASPEGKPVIRHTKNLYPVVRHTILIAIILLFITLIVFLMHQNGKSIYDNGI